MTFLGVQIMGSYVALPQIKIRRNIKTLHDAQQLVGSLQWLCNIVLIPPEIMSPFYLLLQGKQPWEKKCLTPEAVSSLDVIEHQMSSGSLSRWNPGVLLDLYVYFGGGVGALAQGTPNEARPIQWESRYVHSPRGFKCLGNLIMNSRKLALSHLGVEPARIHLPFCKQLPTLSTAMSEHLALALLGFAGEL